MTTHEPSDVPRLLSSQGEWYAREAPRQANAGTAAGPKVSLSADGYTFGDHLRVGDLAYLHVHPEGTPGDGNTPAGPGITFHAPIPTAGQYRPFLDFKAGDVVHTAEFTVVASRMTM